MDWEALEALQMRTFKMKLFSIVVAIFLIAGVTSAAAQNICAERGELVKKLWDKWQEAQVARGLVNDNRLVEIFVSQKGSWTIIISDISGKSCVASAGKNWVSRGFKAPGKGT